jgi:hypothetical protein
MFLFDAVTWKMVAIDGSVAVSGSCEEPGVLALLSPPFCTLLCGQLMHLE